MGCIGLFGIGDAGFESNFCCYVVYTGECLKLGLFSLFTLGWSFTCLLRWLCQMYDSCHPWHTCYHMSLNRQEEEVHWISGPSKYLTSFTPKLLRAGWKPTIFVVWPPSTIIASGPQIAIGKAKINKSKIHNHILLAQPFFHSWWSVGKY